MSEKTDQAVRFAVNDAVTWKSSGVSKTGMVVAVIPAGMGPQNCGYGKLGFSTLPRPEESYIVRAWHTGAKKTGAGKIYWPFNAWLKPVDGLSDAEIEWCRANASAVRAFIESKTGT